MALPTKEEIQTGQFSYDGTPWINVTSKSDIDSNKLDLSYDGTPWWGVSGVSTILDNIKKVGGIALGQIKKIGGVLKSNIKKIGDILK